MQTRLNVLNGLARTTVRAFAVRTLPLAKRVVVPGSLALTLMMSTPTHANTTLFNNDALTQVGTVTLTVTSVSPGATVQVTFSSSPFPTLAGLFNFSSTPSLPENEAFCVELDRFISLNQSYTYEVWSASGRVGALLALKSSFLTGADLNNKAAAFQIAMWEIAYDHALGNPDDLNAGVFQYNADPIIVGYANSLLTATANQTAAYFFLRGQGQTEPQNLATIVPEPASLLALGAGLVFVAFRKHRKA
ncbi:MAG: PEP-CTERM sorting domain-containing protein [Armatimonadetes bacterium]|nr:PEP-CTERM sorting domain-containing protein [Armatimonadota bacterium]CUU36564.1 PEP-CTERM protein-sorting domain-containing protein [Armatimonadetes bacterium DC]